MNIKRIIKPFTSETEINTRIMNWALLGMAIVGTIVIAVCGYLILSS
jgi:hypothetical protein